MASEAMVEACVLGMSESWKFPNPESCHFGVKPIVSGDETDISEHLPAKQILNVLTFRGAPSGKGAEAWRDNFFLKVGVVRIRALVSKKYPSGKEGARARGPPDLGPWAQIWAHGHKFGPWAQIWAQIQPV